MAGLWAGFTILLQEIFGGCFGVLSLLVLVGFIGATIKGRSR